MKTIKQILTDAADFGERYGVAKGHFVDDTGAMCIQGLIVAGIWGRPLEKARDISDRINYHPIWDQIAEPVYQKAAQTVAKFVEPYLGHYGNLAPWNNHPKLPASEVIATLRKAAEHAEG